MSFLVLVVWCVAMCGCHNCFVVNEMFFDVVPLLVCV